MSKRIAKVLREAARLIEEGEALYGCHAINDVEGVPHYTRSSPVRFYESLYMGGEDGSGVMDGSWLGHDAEQYCYGPRVVALCLAAAIAEDSGGCSPEPQAK